MCDRLYESLDLGEIIEKWEIIEKIGNNWKIIEKMGNNLRIG